MSNIEARLGEIGLNPSEIRSYLHLLEHGMATPTQLSRGTKILRTNVYHVLALLRQKGLVSEHKRGGKNAFSACDPAALLATWEKKKDTIEDLLPDLRALHAKQENKPSIRFYDGFEQVKEVYRHAIEGPHLFALGSTKRLMELDPEFERWFLKRIKKNKVIVQDILTAESRKDGMGEALLLSMRPLYEHVYLAERFGEMPTDILVWSDSVAIIALNEPIYATVLQNRAVADTFRIMFRVMWGSLKTPRSY